MRRCERLLAEATALFERLQIVTELERTRALPESLATAVHVTQRGG
jgi:hypothetical protein